MIAVHMCEYCNKVETEARRKYCCNKCRIAALVKSNRNKHNGRPPMDPADRKVGLSIHLTPAQAAVASVAGGGSGRRKVPWDHKAIKRGVQKILEDLIKKQR